MLIHSEICIGGIKFPNKFLTASHKSDNGLFYCCMTMYDSFHAWFYKLGKCGQFVNRHNDREKSRRRDPDKLLQVSSYCRVAYLLSVAVHFRV